MQEVVAAQLLTAASAAAKRAGFTPKLLQQLSNTAQLQLSDLAPSPSAADTVRRMSTLSEQLPWQLRQQPAEQVPDSTGEQASAEDTAVSTEAEPGATTPLWALAPASEVGSCAQQLQQQQQQGLPSPSVTDEGSVFGSSSMMGDMGQGGKGDEETAARAAYRQWSESFEAGRVMAAVQSGSVHYTHRQTQHDMHALHVYMCTHLLCVFTQSVCAYEVHVYVMHKCSVPRKAREMSLNACSEADSGV